MATLVTTVVLSRAPKRSPQKSLRRPYAQARRRRHREERRSRGQALGKVGQLGSELAPLGPGGRWLALNEALPARLGSYERNAEGALQIGHPCELASVYSLRSLAWSSNSARSPFAGRAGMTSDKGSDTAASDEYGNLDRHHSSSAMGKGSMLTPAHHEASSP
jgi:hypothetical protein